MLLNIDVGQLALCVPQHTPVAGELSQVHQVTELSLLKSQIRQIILIAINYVVQDDVPAVDRR